MTEALRVIVLKDGDVYVAQCLEVDISAQGRSEDEAMSRLKAVLHAECEEAAAAGRDVMSIGPAPFHFRTLYNADVVQRTKLVA